MNQDAEGTPDRVEASYELPGERLNLILDQLGFKKGRGRQTEFHQYLVDSNVDIFHDLKFRTVRSWFRDISPPMRKIQLITQALDAKYSLGENVSQIQAWWKVGGLNPFSNKETLSENSVTSLQRQVQDNQQKASFVTMSLVKEEAGDFFDSLSGAELLKIKETVDAFSRDFSDPLKIDCPNEYLKVFIRAALRSVVEEKGL